MLALGIDPGTATVGYGLVRELDDGSLQAVDYGVITTPPSAADGGAPADDFRGADGADSSVTSRIAPPSKKCSSAKTSRRRSRSRRGAA